MTCHCSANYDRTTRHCCASRHFRFRRRTMTIPCSRCRGSSEASSTGSSCLSHYRTTCSDRRRRRRRACCSRTDDRRRRRRRSSGDCSVSWASAATRRRRPDCDHVTAADRPTSHPATASCVATRCLTSADGRWGSARVTGAASAGGRDPATDLGRTQTETTHDDPRQAEQSIAISIKAKLESCS